MYLSWTPLRGIVGHAMLPEASSAPFQEMKFGGCADCLAGVPEINAAA